MALKIVTFGTCVVRDVFGTHENDGGYDIHNIMDIHPISAVSQSMMLKNISEDDPYLQKIMDGNANFYKRMMFLDWRKGIFENLAAANADYIVIDGFVGRLNLIKSGADKFITLKHNFKSSIDGLMKGGYMPKDVKALRTSQLSDEEFEFYMDCFIDNLLNIFDKERIIFLEEYGSIFYTDGRKMRIIKSYNDYRRQRAESERINNFFYKRLPECCIIEFPYGVPADKNHKWGPNWVHYTPEYYHYALEAINSIIANEGATLAEKKITLSDIKKKHEGIIREKYEPILFNSLGCPF